MTPINTTLFCLWTYYCDRVDHKSDTIICSILKSSARRKIFTHVYRAHGLQTVIQLLSEKELYEYYADDVKTQHINWNQQMAGAVLETWQRKFAMVISCCFILFPHSLKLRGWICLTNFRNLFVQEVKRQMKMISEEDSHYNVFSFSTVTLNDSLSHYSKVDLKKIFIGYLIMVSTYNRWNFWILPTISFHSSTILKGFCFDSSAESYFSHVFDMIACRVVLNGGARGGQTSPIRQPTSKLSCLFYIFSLG